VYGLVFRNLKGVATLTAWATKICSEKINGSDKVEKIFSPIFKRVSKNDTLGKLDYVLQGSPFAVVVELKKSE